MILAISIVAFLATFGVCLALVFALSSDDSVVARRLTSLLRSTRSERAEDQPSRSKEVVEKTLTSVGQLLPASEAELSQKRAQLIRAGIRNPAAVLMVRGIGILLPFIMLALVFFTGLYRWNPFLILITAFVIGYLAPDLFLRWKVRQRQTSLRLALPDALDLLVICVESGLGLDQAMMRVSQELRVAHPDLSDELQLVNLEMRVGKTRLEALRGLADRTGVDDIRALVAMLVQTDRFGTSVAQSLRIHSEDLRTRRRQRAEEKAAKTTVKMVPPLVFFIFPALMIVILGPAVITVVRVLLPGIK
ncbi:MAG: type II secretion system F family protein [Candidatus Acidiferrales bacterium]